MRSSSTSEAEVKRARLDPPFGKIKAFRFHILLQLPFGNHNVHVAAVINWKGALSLWASIK